MANTNNRREYLGSPVFSESLGALNAGALTIVDFSQNATPSEKYAPFNNLRVTNTSAEPLDVAINQNDDRTVRIAGNTIQEFDKKSFPAIRSVRVKNVGSSATSAGDVLVEVQKEVVDQETIVSRVANKLFSGAGV